MPEGIVYERFERKTEVRPDVHLGVPSNEHLAL